jgi:hypothetical protein
MKARHLNHATAVAALLGAALVLACDDNGSDVSAPDPAPILRATTSVSGEVDASISAFAAAIGAVDNKGAPNLHDATGRRGVNWDGVPAQFTNTDAFPATFFNLTATRGLEYISATGGLRVSDNHFADVNPTYATDLIPFSDPRMFAPVGTNRAEIRFRIPGTDTAAVVQSFGAVVVDVDKPNTTRLQAYDKDDRLIADVPVPVRADPDEYSLIGVQFDRPAIARIVMTLGDTPIGAGVNDVSSGGTADVVVLDDLLYSEPQPLQ